jgi:ribonuclease G
MPLVKRLVINATAHETRAALLEDGVVVELFVERTRDRGIVGNIYKGRVRKILPGMQSAFVDVGLEKDAFLYVSDVGDTPSADEPWLADAVEETVLGVAASAPAAATPIEELLHEGDSLVVQVAKEPIAGKGARVTAHVTLPGRYVVYMPTVRHLGISRRIDSEAERARLKALVSGLREKTGSGYIVRTAGAGCDEAALTADAAHLSALWQSLGERVARVDAPALVHAEVGLLDKLLRDVVAGEFAEVVVDDEEAYRRCRESLARIDPALGARVARYLDPDPLFERFGIEAEIEKALQSKVWLKSGGYIVINQTEALVAIDVNTGRYVGKVRLEDTVLKTNLEAVREIVRQIRLRDLGGIIVLDFIDMEESGNRARVVTELEHELRRDRSKSKILQISDFGLVEMTRKRVKRSLERLLMRPCPHCGGSGRVKSAETVCLELARELRKAERSFPGGVVEIAVHPQVASALSGAEAGLLRDLGVELGLRVEVRADPRLHADQYEFAVP